VAAGDTHVATVERKQATLDAAKGPCISMTGSMVSSLRAMLALGATNRTLHQIKEVSMNVIRLTASTTFRTSCMLLAILAITVAGASAPPTGFVGNSQRGPQIPSSSSYRTPDADGSDSGLNVAKANAASRLPVGTTVKMRVRALGSLLPLSTARSRAVASYVAPHLAGGRPQWGPRHPSAIVRARHHLPGRLPRSLRPASAARRPQFPAQQSTGWSPADDSLAVGSQYILQAVNTTITGWPKSRTASAPFWQYNLSSWLSLPSGGACVDTEVTYLRWVDRFAFVCLEINDGASDIHIVVSGSGGPSSRWCNYRIGTPGVVDQPTLEATSDKIGVSGAMVNGPAAGRDLAIVYNESAMLNCQRAAGNYIEVTPAVLRAATQLSYQAPARFVGVGGGIWVWTISGTPGATAVSASGRKVAGMNYAVLSDPSVPGGNVGGHDLDNRFMSATEEYIAGQGDIMELENTQACSTNLCDETTRVNFGCYCVTRQYFLTEGDGYSWIYGSGTLDSSGDVFLAYSRVNPNTTPQAAALAVDTTPRYRWNNIIWGNTPGSSACGDERWGDYLTAAPDPTQAGQIWFASEYQARSCGGGWGTVIAEGTINSIE
jgi:hypothetical protein